MFSSTKAKAVAAGLLALALVGGTAQAASARASYPEESSSTFYLLDDNAQLRPEGTPIAWNGFTIGYPHETDTLAEVPFPGSEDATGVFVFLSNRGAERDRQNWLGLTINGFMPGTKNVLYPNVSLNTLMGSNMGAVQTNGGQFSLGIAFTKGNGVQIADAGVMFAHITVEPGGTWTYEATTGTGGGEQPQTGDIDLEAQVVFPEPGDLQLIVPEGAKATFGTPELVNGLSTSTAVLPTITVKDERYDNALGWTLTQSVQDFVSGSNVIEARHLGVAPRVTSTGTNAVAAAAQTAGSSVFPAPFAEAAAGSQSLGTTTLGADLTLVAPADAPAGTYTSKMTVTLVSK